MAEEVAAAAGKLGTVEGADAAEWIAQRLRREIADLGDDSTA